MKFITSLIALFLILISCKNYEHTYSNDTDFNHLDINGFTNEIINGWGTYTTSQFNAYIPVSYHVNKVELAQHVQNLANTTSSEIQALIIIGPTALMWEYRTILIKNHESDSTKKRVNFLTFPHARITYKATNVVSNHLVDSLFQSISSASFLNEGIPAITDFNNKVDIEITNIDSKYDLLILFKYDDKFKYYWGYINDSPDKAINRILKGSVTTYSH
ncbi:MAG: hypothetical protein RLN81_10690 [Balneolaceae bacterium]